MPIVNFHLVDGAFTPDQHQKLLLESSRFFAEVLEAPIARVRATIALLRPELFATGGVLNSPGNKGAPYFTVFILEGRPVEQRQRLLTGLTDIVINVLDADRDAIRGFIVPVHPDNWSIGGVPASIKRGAEMRAREQAKN
jgi:4-oxalocrotonate tautomerase family enzyme